MRRPAFTLDLPLAVEPGEVVALVGPNGAGKTTFLHAVAGLVDLDDGHVTLGARTMDDVAAGIHLPAEERQCGLVFQQHLLFPHLSAVENVAFGLRARRVAHDEARRVSLDWLTRVGVAAHADHPASKLSGGQAQRVALARTLAVEPDVLLLDEPFAALDEDTRPLVQDLLREQLLTRPAVLVTHDPDDARALADRVVPIFSGRRVVSAR